MNGRERQAQLVLERMARLDERILNAGHRALLGEAIRAAAILPAQALSASDDPDKWRASAATTVAETGAFLARAVLSARDLEIPSASGLLALIERNPLRDKPVWRQRHALWGRVAELVFTCGELGHVTDDLEADCIGAIGALDGCLEFLVALEEGELAGHGERGAD